MENSRVLPNLGEVVADGDQGGVVVEDEEGSLSALHPAENLLEFVSEE